jgi:hypothetical protein
MRLLIIKKEKPFYLFYLFEADFRLRREKKYNIILSTYEIRREREDHKERKKFREKKLISPEVFKNIKRANEKSPSSLGRS